eukprot:5096274-Pyramimonas_sp.AAC.1
MSCLSSLSVTFGAALGESANDTDRVRAPAASRSSPRPPCSAPGVADRSRRMPGLACRWPLPRIAR